MLSNFVVGIFLGLGVGGWTYSKAMHANGGLTQRALLVGAISGFIAFLLAITLLSVIFHT